MRIDVITLFPEMIENTLEASVIGRAVSSGIIELNTVNLRDFAADKHRSVDDTPIGGGPGMLLKPDIIKSAVNSLLTDDAHVVMLTPQGHSYDQNIAAKLAVKKHLILLCGHYEGVDERVRQTLIDEEISVGDYVLTNGSIAAPVVIDAAVRLIPGVLGSEDSAATDSFSGNSSLLEYPQYTKPAALEARRAPHILSSGNHKNIKVWQKKQSYIRTLARRPDLIDTNVREKEK